ncbi:retropepsin-like aspartic protease [Saccharibacillus sp. JS10]|uniref:retropepsin-like aspartic protease n=1 Tax=Saccharibacillus sp. JS10 TaxID=2950552 RepID=UPI00210D8551|nr:retropepsin-like aspartic protease [Saccharibacillus sp. JS10]MCQ4088443.1 retroviral-like aspartic protease family protein [Saccharibacillus sp. JS10]
MNIEYRDGLLFTEITVHFNKQKKIISNIVIDTGASHSLISQDEVDEIGIHVGIEDEIITSYGIGGKEHAFSKRIEGIQVGDFVLRDVYIDFTSFKYHNINRLLGLDVLTKGEFDIDLKAFKLLRS